MSTYQLYDFVKDINFHIKNQTPVDLTTKSEIFKTYLFKLKLFQLNSRIKKNHPLFQEDYFLFIKFTKVYVARKIDNDVAMFDYAEILNGIKIIRKMKLKKLFKFFI